MTAILIAFGLGFLMGAAGVIVLAAFVVSGQAQRAWEATADRWISENRE